jgi:hypothetical protein
MLDGLTIIQSTVAAGTLIVLFVVSDDRDLESYADFTGQQTPNQRPDKFYDDAQICQQLENHINIHCSSFPVCITGQVGTGSSNQGETGTSAF